MVNGGLNVCITGNQGIVLNVVDIDPILILVAIEGAPDSYDDCITKQSLLPLTLTDGSYYYQPCFYCANLVETIISPSAILSLHPAMSLTDGSRLVTRNPASLAASNSRATMA
jgi:hypothetical protein